MSTVSLAQRLAVTGSLPRLEVQNRAPIRIGFLVPLSGPQEGWGGPGVEGCRIWVDWINARGGLMVGGKRHLVEMQLHDSALGPQATLEAAREMIEQARVRLVLILGGNNVAEALDYLMERKVLVATLLPSDLSPDRPYLIAPTEVHPFFNVTGVDWLTRTRPQVQRVALCSQTDLLGLPSLAVYRAAFRAAKREIVQEVRYDPEGANASEIVARMIAETPDLLCWCSSDPPMIEELTVAAYEQGFSGEILCCNADYYPRILAQTSPEFMERFTFQFPDFDDPKLADKAFFFRRPKAFFDTYQERFPDRWSAVSWEYASILDLWYDAVEVADSTAPISVLAALKRGRQMPNAFGPARWWGDEIYGINNALVGKWPVVTIRGGKARIEELGSALNWLERHDGLLQSELKTMGLLWSQRLRSKAAMVAP